MAAERETRATHQEVEGFVKKLRDFHDSLSDSEQAMHGVHAVHHPGRGERLWDV
jgi:hypothetical protein